MSIKFSFPCNTIDFSTNKGKKPPNIQIEIDRIGIRYKELNIIILKPTLDRLTFGFCPDKHFVKKYMLPGWSLDELTKHWKQSLFHESKIISEKTGLSHITSGVSFKKQPYASYNVNLRYKPPSSQHSILIQIAPKADSNKAFMRFDMNPRHFSKKAIGEFRAFIEDVLTATGSNVSYDDFLMWCQIYRADICVDILGARPAEMEIRYMKNKKPSPEKSHIYKSKKTGRTETVYPKAKKDKSSTEYIYDKRQERIDLGEPPMYGDFLHSRYESRVQKTTFHKLAHIKNRCNRISVRVLDTAKLHKLPYIPHLFIRHALERTLEKALEIIPPQHQSSFKKRYEANMRNIWLPDKLWSYWKDTLVKSGIFPKK